MQIDISTVKKKEKRRKIYQRPETRLRLKPHSLSLSATGVVVVVAAAIHIVYLVVRTVKERKKKKKIPEA